MEFTIRVVTGNAPEGLGPRPDNDFGVADNAFDAARLGSEVPEYAAVFLDGVLVWAGEHSEVETCGCVLQIANEKIVQGK